MIDSKEAPIATKRFLETLMNAFHTAGMGGAAIQGNPNIAVMTPQANVFFGLDMRTREVIMLCEGERKTMGHMRRRTTFNRAVRKCVGELLARQTPRPA